jgi:hypothetical protein
MTTSTLLVVDAANVVGSVPDGWWHDRAGAACRLRDALATVAEQGLDGLPPPLEVVLVVEGAARDTEAIAGVRVESAPRSGDDAIVALVEAALADGDGAGRDCVVVTADRELRERVRAAGARVIGPRSVPRRPGQRAGSVAGSVPGADGVEGAAGSAG